MNGTRTARIAALSAALVLAVALAATTLLSNTPHDRPHRGGTSALTDRAPVLLRSVERGTAEATPRTTPPPALNEPTATGRPAQAETVEHS